MANYKLLEKTEDGQKIEKSGHVHEFTAESVTENLNTLNTQEKEMRAQVELNGAEMQNIEHFHPFVKKLTDEQLAIAYLYQRSKSTFVEAGKKVLEIEKTRKSLMEAIKEIKEQTGLEIEVPKPFEKPKVVVEGNKYKIDFNEQQHPKGDSNGGNDSGPKVEAGPAEPEQEEKPIKVEVAKKEEDK